MELLAGRILDSFDPNWNDPNTHEEAEVRRSLARMSTALQTVLGAGPRETEAFHVARQRMALCDWHMRIDFEMADAVRAWISEAEAVFQAAKEKRRD